jgi:hypothetical protein
MVIFHEVVGFNLYIKVSTLKMGRIESAMLYSSDSSGVTKAMLF